MGRSGDGVGVGFSGDAKLAESVCELAELRTEASKERAERIPGESEGDGRSQKATEVFYVFGQLDSGAEEGDSNRGRKAENRLQDVRPRIRPVRSHLVRKRD